MSSSTAPQADSKDRGAGLTATISAAIGLGALAGGTGYAIMRYSYQRFYNGFGLTPDDIGPSSGAALTQSGAGVVAFIALFAVLPLTLALLVSTACARAVECRRQHVSRRHVPAAILLGHKLERGPTVRSWSCFIVDVVVGVVVADGIFLAFVRSTGGHWESFVLIVIAFAVVLLTARRYADQPKEPATVFDATFAPLRRLPGAGWIVAALMTAVGTLVLASSLPVDAELTARCAIANPTLRVGFVRTHRTFPGVRHLPVLRVRADPAAALPTEKAQPGPLSAKRPSSYPFIYLGNASGRYFLYAVKARQTLEMPDSDVVVLRSPLVKSCQWCHERSKHLLCA
jgi:hypothetical protein